jgi:predicted nucleic acid-binding protein
LLIAKRRGLIPAVRPVIDELMITAKFRVSSQLYREVLTAANELLTD